MAFDEGLARRIQQLLEDHAAVDERKMFGGIAFLVRGHMCCGVAGERLMVRIGPDAYEAALAMRHAEPMDFTGRPLRGMVYVRPEGLRTRRQLASWVNRGVSFVATLPAKTRSVRKRPRTRTARAGR